MTQLTSLALPNTSGRKQFILEVRSPDGSRVLNTYTSDAPGGVVGGFVSRRSPTGVCGKLTFTARPDLVTIPPRAITYLRYDTGEKIIPVHMGVVTSCPDSRSKQAGTFEVEGGKELLKTSVCASAAYPEASFSFQQDVNVLSVARSLLRNYMPPSLKYDRLRLADTDVVTRSVDAREANLYEALETIIKTVPEIRDTDWGVDAEGYVVIRAASGTVSLPYDDVQAQFDSNIDASNVVTKATIRVANAVTEGAVVSAGYRPGLVSYTYEAPEHATYRAERSFKLEETDEGKSVVDVLTYSPTTGFAYGGGVNGWQPSIPIENLNTVVEVISDGNVETHIYPGSANPGTLTLTAFKGERFVGSALIIDAPTGSYDIRLEIAYQYSPAQGGSDRVTRYTVKFDLNRVKGLGKVEMRLIAPMALGGAANIVDVAFVYSGTLPTTLKIYEFRGLEANNTLLDKIARAQIRLPAKEVSEVTCAKRVYTQGGRSYGIDPFLLEAPAKTLRLTGVTDDAGEPLPDIVGEIAEVVDTDTNAEGMLSRISTGNPVRDATVRAIQRAVNTRY